MVKPDVLSDRIWVQTVCKGYQQTTKVATSRQRVKLLTLDVYMILGRKSIINPLYTGNPLTGTFTNSADLDEMPR